jgi:small subunit ribosomal protein S25e
MGGKKKSSIKKMDNTSEKKGELQKREKKSSRSASEKKIPGIVLPDLSEKIIGEVKKMKVLTPYTIGSRFNLRLSVARRMLNELAKRGIIEYVSGSKYLRIYKVHN